MFELAIETSKGTFVSKRTCSDESCLIGKSVNCFEQLHGWRVGKQHAQIYREESGVYIKDLDTKYGTYVNGKKIEQYGPLSTNDLSLIHI